MKNKSIVFTGCDQVEVQELEENLEQLQAREVIVKTSYSLVSAGTELTCLAGSESWFSFPSTPGYTSVGEVVKVGDQVIKVSSGGRGVHLGRAQAVQSHQPGQRANRFAYMCPMVLRYHWFPSLE